MIAKKRISILGLIIAFFVNPVQSGEVIWSPLHGNPVDTFVPVDSMGQIGSEVIMIVLGPGVIWDISVNIPSEKIPVEFPSLFLSHCLYSLEFRREWDNQIYAGRSSDSHSKYNYDIGNGWILHRKGNSGIFSDRFSSSLGWIYIQHYPWVYGLDWGWRYFLEDGIAWNANAWWIYEVRSGWFWTTRNLYPYIYKNTEGWVSYEATES